MAAPARRQSFRKIADFKTLARQSGSGLKFKSPEGEDERKKAGQGEALELKKIAALSEIKRKLFKALFASLSRRELFRQIKRSFF